MSIRLESTTKLKLLCSLLLSFIINVDCLTMSTGETRWQLFNHCSNAMLQTYLGNINARGSSLRLCLTDFNVKVNRLGMLQLQHAQSRKYVCFNRRKRVTVRIEGDNIRCFFIERLNEQGYTEIESAWEPGLFLGFNKRGRFQDPTTYHKKRKCFYWTKSERFVPNSELHRCARQQKKKLNHNLTTMPSESFYRNMAREQLLQRIRATEDGPYNIKNFTTL
ncbi:unnamed protein product [Cylicocyclus nassatus]|uniref:Fibroblast growth factor 17 n=1 Tax=Cylicocyclus nassatus TaxID=53992 RepID=A0AA36HE25_CYLNA|nr:unnamed protein product [Cylicocyclus nassatus]